nr:nucleotide-binding alpha-beta plait domain-containing protein [Tanacetum cinerariifolium]
MVGRLKLNANVTRFNIENLKSSRIVDKTAKRFNKNSHNTFHKTVGNKDIGNSFVNVVKGSGMSLETESTPMIVLDDECLNTKDLSCSLMGIVKEFTSLSNLKKVLCNEGFDVLKISYLGELWVLIEFESAKVKDLFKKNGGANSWFSVLNQAFEDFTLGRRIAWVEVEGITFKLWLGHTFNLIASKWGKLIEVDDYDDTNFHSKRLRILTKDMFPVMCLGHPLSITPLSFECAAFERRDISLATFTVDFGFDKPPENRARIDICFPNVLSNDQRDDLERMIMKEEVEKAVWDCGSDKSPGLDGFSFSFAIFGQQLKKIFLRLLIVSSRTEICRMGELKLYCVDS